MIGVCALTLLGGLLFKAQCTAPEGWDGRQYSRLCYNDIQPLYGGRFVEEKFPYVDGRLVNQELLDGAIEYPVLTGVFMWVTGLVAGDSNAYLFATAALLAPFGVMIAYLLAQMSRTRALMWAAAPALVLYAFHNWDLLAVGAAVAGIWLWWRDKDIAAGIAFGIGGALKVYPAFLLAPLVLYVARKRDLSAAVTAGGLGVATLLSINLPFAIANFDGWFATYEFHSLRLGNFDSIWNLGFPSLTSSQLNLWTGALTVAAFIGALVVGWIRSRDGRLYPFLEVSAALVTAFLLFGKVHSPQYTLWLLPFFVLTSVGVGWWIAYSLVDLAVYVGVFRWFYDFSYEGQDFTFFKKLMITGVWGRAALLAILFVVFLRARRISPQEGAAKLSQPLPKVPAVGTASSAPAPGA